MNVPLTERGQQKKGKGGRTRGQEGIELLDGSSVLNEGRIRVIFARGPTVERKVTIRERGRRKSWKKRDPRRRDLQQMLYPKWHQRTGRFRRRPGTRKKKKKIGLGGLMTRGGRTLCMSNHAEQAILPLTTSILLFVGMTNTFFSTIPSPGGTWTDFQKRLLRREYSLVLQWRLWTGLVITKRLPRASFKEFKIKERNLGE